MPPPTRAKRAIDEAPKEKPVITVITLLTFSADSTPNIWLYSRNKAPNPSTPRPTTPRPITEPPAKATSSALPRLVRAALVVRTLALVATRMPMKPASAEHRAPVIKERAIRGEDPSALPLMPSKMATANTKMIKTRYSALRKAIAPSAMALAMRSIRSVPTSCLATQADFQNVYNNPNTPKAGTR